MGITTFIKAAIIPVVLTAMICPSCTKDDEIFKEIEKTEPSGPSDGQDEGKEEKPVITLDNETGIYTVKIGRELTIAPSFSNVDNDRIIWEEDDEIIATGPVLKSIWDKPGTHYITIIASNPKGKTFEEIRVDILELAPPAISLPFESDVVTVKTGAEFKVSVQIGNSEEDNGELTITWSIDGVVASTTTEFIYTPTSSGEKKVEVKAVNDDGQDLREFTLKVIDELSESLHFPALSNSYTSTDRYTFVGRPVYLKPICVNLQCNKFSWSVNGIPVDNNKEYFMYAPTTSGEYHVSVNVDDKAIATVKVICVSASEEEKFRKISSPQAKSNKVYEYIPAPGQFIGDTQTGGMTGNELTHEQAIKWAENRLKNETYVSLGAWGGYIVVGFDHSIPANSGAYDFSIQGNAFFNAGTTEGGSNEPGIVYVMQDVNGNGLPDDEWFELRGSETGKSTTYQDYAVTYYRPAAPCMNVQWTDNYGNSGTIDYLKAYHKQDYYYPSWINADYYTLRGTRIQSQTSQNNSTGYWDNSAFDWGYADNLGKDNLTGSDAVTGDRQRTGFKISNAMYPDGTPIELKYIDFIKVQTGVQSKAGWLGEVSTEVFSFIDLSVK